MPDELNTPFDVELEAGLKDRIVQGVIGYFVEKVAEFGAVKAYENLPEHDPALKEVQPQPFDAMGNYTGATDLYGTPSTQAHNPPGASSQPLQTTSLVDPNPIGSGTETFDPEPGEVGPNPRTFEQP